MDAYLYVSIPLTRVSLLLVDKNGDVENAHTGNDDDREDLYDAIKDQIDADLRNYEEYMCDDWYHRDSRWK